MPHRLLTSSTLSLIMAVVMAVVMAMPTQVTAQGLFAPAIRVNDSAITGWELQQRERFLTLLGAPNPAKLAREQLVEDRLKLQAAAAAGFVPEDEAVAAAMAEFAGRRDLKLDAFLKELGKAGVAPQTLRDFVRAGLVWRQLVQTRFGARSIATDEELDRALAAGPDGTSIRVALSEIIIPIPQGREADVERLVDQLVKITSVRDFAAAARRFSAARTREQDGRVPWRGITELPPGLQTVVLGLTPGEVSSPISLQGAVALFQLRAIEEVGYRSPAVGALDFATVRIPGGRTPEALAQAKTLSDSADRCDDLYGLLRGSTPDMLIREALPVAEIPRDIAGELARLDPGETSFSLTRDEGNTLVFLMLCTRVAELREGEARENLARGLRNQRLETLANSFLAQLRAEARIVGP
ncbi:MAG: peptidylprolyl isomerase [Paracoccaceae bacterium]